MKNIKESTILLILAIIVGIALVFNFTSCQKEESFIMEKEKLNIEVYCVSLDPEFISVESVLSFEKYIRAKNYSFVLKNKDSQCIYEEQIEISKNSIVDFDFNTTQLTASALYIRAYTHPGHSTFYHFKDKRNVTINLTDNDFKNVEIK